MTALRFVTALNWAVIALLGFLVVAETLTPAKGGEAAGRGIGQFFYYLAIAALVVLLVLNLLPYAWARYAALGLVLLPIFFWQIHPAWQKLKRAAGSHLEQAKPIFPDPARERIARAIQDGKADVVRELLRTPPANLNDNGELLAFAIQAANQSTYKPAERLACLELLFQAGTRLDAVDRGADVPIHFAVADAGHAALLRLLLKQGADANAVQRYFKRPILFEAVASHQEPEASVKALLDFGAQPNATTTFDDDQGPVTPLWRAVELERWGVSATLIERGADLNFKAANGRTIRSLIDEAAPSFKPNGYATQDDIERLKRLLK